MPVNELYELTSTYERTPWAYVGKRYAIIRWMGRWNVARYSDFSDLMRNGRVDEYLEENMLKVDAMRRLNELEAS